MSINKTESDEEFLSELILRSNKRYAYRYGSDNHIKKTYNDMVCLNNELERKTFNHNACYGERTFGYLIFLYMKEIEKLYIYNQNNEFESSFEILTDIYNKFKYKIRINENFYVIIHNLIEGRYHVTETIVYRANALENLIKSIIVDMASIGILIDINFFSEKISEYDVLDDDADLPYKEMLPDFHEFVLNSVFIAKEYNINIVKALNIYIIKDLVNIIAEYIK